MYASIIYVEFQDKQCAEDSLVHNVRKNTVKSGKGKKKWWKTGNSEKKNTKEWKNENEANNTEKRQEKIGKINNNEN